MKILIITHGYAPQLNPRSFRWTALAEELAGTVEIDVVTLRVADALLEETRAGVRVHRVGPQVDTRLRAQVPAKMNPGLKWLYRQTWRKIMWPDYACLWYFDAVKKARELCAENNYDWMISVSHPFTGHMVGLKLKKDFPQLKWMVDIGDPFTFLEGQPPNNRRLYGALNRAAEKRVLKHADTISVTTGRTQELYEKYFSESRGKITVIPPLLRFPPLSAQVKAPGARKRFAYLGTLYSQIRSPEPLLKLFSKLPKSLNFELHFYGSVNDCASLFEKYPNENIFMHGLVSAEDARRATAECDVLVNLGNQTDYQLPSKTVECLAAGKPLLNIYQADHDSSLALFADHPSLFNLHTSKVEDEAVIRDLETFIHEARTADPQWIATRLQPFSLNAVSGKYRELLK